MDDVLKVTGILASIWVIREYAANDYSSSYETMLMPIGEVSSSSISHTATLFRIAFTEGAIASRHGGCCGTASEHAF